MFFWLHVPIIDPDHYAIENMDHWRTPADEKKRLMISDRARHELGSATLSHKCKVDLRQDALPFGHWMYLPFTFSVTEVILVQGRLR